MQIVWSYETSSGVREARQEVAGKAENNLFLFLGGRIFISIENLMEDSLDQPFEGFASELRRGRRGTKAPPSNT